ncbi:MAG: nuclear transport factor 2 family protein [Chthoniobacterales bacterium]
MSKNPPTEKNQKSAVRTAIIVFIALALGGVGGYWWKTSHDAGPDADSIHEFINQYFTTWSSKDMAGYAACFDSTSMVYFIRDGQVMLRQDKPDFIAGQSEVLRMETKPIEEHPEDMHIVMDNDVAYASVLWKMTKGSTVKRGYDHFVLLRTPKGWQIISLSFYEIPKAN